MAQGHAAGWHPAAQPDSSLRGRCGCGTARALLATRCSWSRASPGGARTSRPSCPLPGHSSTTVRHHLRSQRRFNPPRWLSRRTPPRPSLREQPTRLRRHLPRCPGSGGRSVEHRSRPVRRPFPPQAGSCTERRGRGRRKQPRQRQLVAWFSDMQGVQYFSAPQISLATG